MTRHENKFFLYAIGSAMMLVLTAVTISGFSFEKKQLLVANTVAVSAVVKPSIPTEAYLGGIVFNDTNFNTSFDEGEVPLFNREVFLWKENPEEQPLFVKTAQTNEFGSYSFELKTPGNYFVTVAPQENETIVSPSPAVVVFSFPTHAFSVSVGRGEQYIEELDFSIVAKNK